MPIRSHMDPVLLIPFINVMDNDAARTIPPGREGMPDAAELFKRWRAANVSKSLLFHESYHFWQCLRLPYMQWYSMITLKACLMSFGPLARASSDPAMWPNAGKISAIRPLGTPSYIGRTPGQPFTFYERAAPDRWSLSPLDLLEGATSFAQWQVQASPDERREAASFKRWCKRNPSYTGAYRLAEEVVAPDIVFWSFLPMVCEAFSCTQPVQAFVFMLQVLEELAGTHQVASAVASQDPARWVTIVEWLHSHVQVDGDPDSTTEIEGAPYVLLHQEFWASLSLGDGEPGHPVVGALARDWAERESREPWYRHILPMPGWITEFDVRTFADLFEPPITVVAFRGDTENRVVLWGNTQGRMADELNRYVAHGMMSIYGSVRRAIGLHIDDTVRLCHHRACPWYPHNLCNAYVNIPKDPKDCGFPREFALLVDEAKKERDHE